MHCDDKGYTRAMQLDQSRVVQSCGEIPKTGAQYDKQN